MNKINIINTDKIATDISSLIDHIASLPPEDKEWLSKIYFREVIKSQHYAVQSQDELATYVNYVGSAELTAKARYIVDWLAGLQERDPNQHSKLSRITFQQALGHSKKWHDELAKKSEKSERYIEPDAENAPKVLDLGDGWEVFWLKTKIAKEAEGDTMGHCVGNGAYDNFGEDEAIFSIRKNDVAHITLHIHKLDVIQAMTKGNGGIPERYQHLVNKTTDVMGVKLFAERPLEDMLQIPDGSHENKNGDTFYTQKGVLHNNDDKPAIIYAKDGTKEWRVGSKLHREDGPAIIKGSGTQIWYQNGKRHREDGPAIIKADHTQEWYQNGKLHRLDGPAIIWKDRNQEWFKNGKRHRDDGPAAIWSDGAQYWFKDGLCHREDGAAITRGNGSKEWRMDGKLHRLDGPAAIDEDGTQEWYQNGLLHRDDGPAVIREGGTQEWYQHDKLHRNDGPAIIYENGIQEWYRNGKLHRLDGPAVIKAGEPQEWWINGKKYTEKEFSNIIKSMETSIDVYS